MARVTLKDIAHSYMSAPQAEADWALKPLHHVWEDGGAFALLGPSGCGKTTLLNIISGLVQPSEGQVLFGEEDVTDRPTAARNIAQVFQFPVIYDTMTVYDNLAFPLRNRAVGEERIKARVEEVAAMLELTPDLKRRARRLERVDRAVHVGDVRGGGDAADRCGQQAVGVDVLVHRLVGPARPAHVELGASSHDPPVDDRGAFQEQAALLGVDTGVEEVVV